MELTSVFFKHYLCCHFVDLQSKSTETKADFLLFPSTYHLINKLL